MIFFRSDNKLMRIVSKMAGFIKKNIGTSPNYAEKEQG